MAPERCVHTEFLEIQRCGMFTSKGTSSSELRMTERSQVVPVVLVFYVLWKLQRQMESNSP